MNNNINKQFLSRYGRKLELKSQNPFIGRCCFIKKNKQIIFYLVTKVKYNDLVTYETLKNCLKHMCELCIQMNLKTISISQESFEFDNINWSVIKNLLDETFSTTTMQINLYENQEDNKFEYIQTILKHNEQQITTYFNPEVDILYKQKNQILASTQAADTVSIKFKHHQLMNSRCIIETKINDFPIDALVDTGADFCYIREELCNELKLEIETYNCDVLVGNNQKLEVIGRVNLNITIANYNYPINCTVVKTLSNALILGWMGFIKDNNGIINAKDGTCILNVQTRQLRSFTFIQESLVLQPFTENLVTVQVHETITSDLIYVNKYEPLFKKAGITIMPGIHKGKKNSDLNSQRQLSLIVTNLSSKTVEIPKFTIVASVSSVIQPEKCAVLNDDSVTVEKDTSINTREQHNHNSKTIIQTPVSTDDDNSPKANPITLSLKNNKLTDSQNQKISELLQKHNKLFEIKTKRKLASNIFHEIDTEDNKPIHNAPNRIAFKERDYIQEQIKEMEESNIISSSSSPWSSRIVLVKKKDGKLRFCIDYRGLNAITKKDVYPLPRIDDSLAMLSKGKFFTTLDLWAGFWQIPLNSKSKEKTAFITDSGLYEFNVMPFGLCNAPATFQRFMDATLAGLNWKTLVVYMDDIIIFSSTFEEHINDVEDVFKRLEKANVTLNQNKCEFFSRENSLFGPRNKFTRCPT